MAIRVAFKYLSNFCIVVFHEFNNTKVIKTAHLDLLIDAYESSSLLGQYFRPIIITNVLDEVFPHFFLFIF